VPPTALISGKDNYLLTKGIFFFWWDMASLIYQIEIDVVAVDKEFKPKNSNYRLLPI
jgi:hypothetical protein